MEDHRLIILKTNKEIYRRRNNALRDAGVAATSHIWCHPVMTDPSSRVFSLYFLILFNNNNWWTA